MTARRGPRGGKDRLAATLAAADDLEAAVEALEDAPEMRAAAVDRLRERRPEPGRPSPLSTAVLARLAGRAGPDGLAAAIPFLVDANPLVQVEVAEALDEVDLADLRPVLLRLAAGMDEPGGAFWEPLVDLISARDEPGVAGTLVVLLERSHSPRAQASIIEVLPLVAAPADRAAVRKALAPFAGDGRSVPGCDTDEGPVTFAMLAAEALAAVDAGGGGG